MPPLPGEPPLPPGRRHHGDVHEVVSAAAGVTVISAMGTAFFRLDAAIKARSALRVGKKWWGPLQFRLLTNQQATAPSAPQSTRQQQPARMFAFWLEFLARAVLLAARSNLAESVTGTSIIIIAAWKACASRRPHVRLFLWHRGAPRSMYALTRSSLIDRFLLEPTWLRCDEAA